MICSFCKKPAKETFRVLVAPTFKKSKRACETCYNRLRGV